MCMCVKDVMHSTASSLCVYMSALIISKDTFAFFPPLLKQLAVLQNQF